MLGRPQQDHFTIGPNHYSALKKGFSKIKWRSLNSCTWKETILNSVLWRVTWRGEKSNRACGGGSNMAEKSEVWRGNERDMNGKKAKGFGLTAAEGRNITVWQWTALLGLRAGKTRFWDWELYAGREQDIWANGRQLHYAYPRCASKLKTVAIWAFANFPKSQSIMCHFLTVYLSGRTLRRIEVLILFLTSQKAQGQTAFKESVFI